MDQDGDSERLLVVIDGPAGAGKSTVARRIAEHYGVPLLDTGAIYRAVALIARRRGVDWGDEAGLAQLVQRFPISFTVAEPGERPRVLYDGEDISEAIRTPEISDGASQVSPIPAVRAGLLEIQRTLARSGCVAEGRDMGTVVFPDARHKFFLTASLEERARRRAAELAERGHAAKADLTRVRDDLVLRDARDSTREAAPLRIADDAVTIDSSELAEDEVVRRIMDAVDAQRGDCS
ncbi:MAG: (d)CMP kinase [Nannocystaceae bacterium]|nr:(d)CMP kinase [Myxococcales bacterium]